MGISLACPEGETPAEKSIRLLGLIDLAYACRLTTDAVRKWPKTKGGYIPAQHQAAVLRLAAAKAVALSAADLIPTGCAS